MCASARPCLVSGITIEFRTISCYCNYMTKLEEFVKYAKALSPEDLKVLEWRLESLMDDTAADHWLTPEQEAKTLAIVNNPDRVLVPEGQVEAIFEKYR